MLTFPYVSTIPKDDLPLLWKVLAACTTNCALLLGGSLIATIAPQVKAQLPVPAETTASTPSVQAQAASSPNPKPDSPILSTLAAKPLATTIQLNDISSIETTAPLPEVLPQIEWASASPAAQAEVAAPKDIAVSQSASDLGEPVSQNRASVDPPNPFQLAEGSNSAPANNAFQPSHALNLWSVRSLRKPVGRKVLDSGVSIAGINPRDISESFWTRDYLTGNWGGLRDRLYDRGVEFTFAAFIDVFSNVSGGRSQNTAYSSVNTISFDFFTDRMGLWKNGQIHWTNAWIDGANISVARDYAGAFNSVFFADPPRRGLRLFELWYGHKFFDGQLDIRLGKIYPS